MSDTNDRCLNFYMSVKTQRQTGNYLVIGLSRNRTDLWRKAMTPARTEHTTLQLLAQRQTTAPRVRSGGEGISEGALWF